MLCVVQVEVSDWPITRLGESYWMCVTVIRCNSIPLHLQWIGRRGPTKSKTLSHSAFYRSTPTTCRCCFCQRKTRVLYPLKMRQCTDQSKFQLFSFVRLKAKTINMQLIWWISWKCVSTELSQSYVLYINSNTNWLAVNTV